MPSIRRRRVWKAPRGSAPRRGTFSALVVSALVVVLAMPIFSALAAGAIGQARAAEEPGLFPFAVSLGAAGSAADLSAWLEKPAGKDGFVRAEGGRLVTDAGPIRFWATNLCFEACFPSAEQAERLAARLASFGINCVRMHHMDNYSIWGDSPDKLTIDPKKLDRLDYLVAQLKQRGIYTNLNLHVSRTLGPKEGFPKVEGLPKYDKGIDNFDPAMIAAQRKYARDLLTHVNPYTGVAYTDEPAMAMVELNNENALWQEWSNGALDALPEPYATTFRKSWNAWLRRKYGGTAALGKAWNAQAVPLGEEMLANGDFSKPLEGAWSLQRDAESEASWSVGDDGPDDRKALTLQVRRRGAVSWIPQFWHSGIAVRKGQPYTLSLLARADAPRHIRINCMMAHAPWQHLGLEATAQLTPAWKPLRYTFVADRDDDNARISFGGLSPGTYALCGVSFRPGGVVGLEPGQTLEEDSVPIVRRGHSGAVEAARRDFVDFLCDTEREYWGGMYRFLKDDLKVKALVSGTQVGWSTPRIQAGLDYIDVHSYWNHPAFPGRPWDPRNWYVRNVAMVNDPPGTLGRLAAKRVAGKALTVSEYNHPAPNVYAAEGFPMIAAFGAMQGWDGIFSFTWSHNADYEPGRITGFFDIKGDTSRLVHMPACAAMFLRGDVAPARRRIAAPMSPAAEREKLFQTQTARSLHAFEFGVDHHACLEHRVALELAAESSAVPSIEPPAEQRAAPPKDASAVAARRFESDTGQIVWDVSRPGAGCFTVVAPRVRLFTGFVGGRVVELGDIRLAIGRTKLDWATVSLVCLDAPGFDQPGRILVAATGWVQNTDMELQRLEADRVTVEDRWGRAPLLCEGVPANLSLPIRAERVRCYPLDESGRRRGAVPVAPDGDRATVQLGPEHRTVWYELEVK